MMSPASGWGWGLQQRSEGLHGGDDVQEVLAGVTRDGPTSDAGSCPGRETQAAPVSSSSQLYLVPR